MQVQEIEGGAKAVYKLTTTAMLSMEVKKEGDILGDTNLSGSLNKQVEKTLPINSEKGHIANMGSMIENLEIDMRSRMDALYIQKTREVVNGIRDLRPHAAKQGNAFVADLAGAIAKHGAGRKVDSES